MHSTWFSKIPGEKLRFGRLNVCFFLSGGGSWRFCLAMGKIEVITEYLLSCVHHLIFTLLLYDSSPPWLLSNDTVPYHDCMAAPTIKAPYCDYDCSLTLLFPNMTTPWYDCTYYDFDYYHDFSLPWLLPIIVTSWGFSPRCYGIFILYDYIYIKDKHVCII